MNIPPSTAKTANTNPATGSPVFCIPIVFAGIIAVSVSCALITAYPILLAMLGSLLSVVNVGWILKLPDSSTFKNTYMAEGGIYDHIGFGFHRYSVDPQWLVPHFEKMLYDQALISMVYIEAFQATGDPRYKKIAEEIFEYVLRDMKSSEGGFYSAEDADTEGVEGKFYLWNKHGKYRP